MLLEQPLPESPGPVLSLELPDLARGFAAHARVDFAAAPPAVWSDLPLSGAGCAGVEFAAAPPGERRWRRLAVTAQYDAWLIAWGAGSGLELHDHGGSSGALHVIRGALVERARDLGATTALVARELRARDTIVVPATRVHAVTNPYATPALTVHVYSPPLTNFARDPA